MRALCLFLVACSSSPAGLDRAVESKLTIDHGIYGQLTLVSDDGGPDTPFAGQDVRLATSDAVLGDTTTDASGFYELAAAPGTYLDCVMDCPLTSDCCKAITLTGLERQDWEGYYPSGGSFCDGECN